MIQLKNITDKQTFHIPKTVRKTDFTSGNEVKDVSITKNGTYNILPSKGKKAINAVNLDVDVYLNTQDKEVIYTENGSYTIEPDDEYNGLNAVEVEVNINPEPYYNEGFAAGVIDQKSKLESIEITENGTYNKEDGYNQVSVNIAPDLQSKIETYTTNGEFTITPDEGFDGLDEVRVSVNFDVADMPFKVPNTVKFAYSPVDKFPDNWDWSEFENVKDCSSLFRECDKLTVVPKLTLNGVTNLSYFFNGCDKLAEFDTSGWNMGAVTTLQYTFAYTLITENPPIDTSNVKSFSYTFSNCKNLTKVTNLNTSKATDIGSLFNYCEKLDTVDEIDCSSITSNISNYSSPFYKAYGLRNFGGFKNLKVTMYIPECYAISYESLMNIINNLADGVSGKTLYLFKDAVDMLSDDDIAIATNKGWSISPAKSTTDTVVVIAMSQVPSSVYQIHPNTYNFSQYTGSWQSSTTTALPNRNNLYVFEGDVSSTVNATQMFRGCSKLRSLHLYNANNFTDTTRMLSGCTYLIEVNVQDWDVSKVTNMKGMFYNTGNFEADFSTWDVSGVTDFDEMFYDSEIKTVDMSNWKHPNSSRMKNMFANSTVETVVFGDTSGVYTMDSIFTGCKALKSVTMTYPLSSSLSNSSMFSSVTTEGIFYYNPAYDYSMIIAKLPATWTAVPIS